MKKFTYRQIKLQSGYASEKIACSKLTSFKEINVITFRQILILAQFLQYRSKVDF